MTTIFETERLVVRPWDPERDAAQAHLIYSKPEVVRFLGRPPEVSVETTRERLRRYVAQEKGLGALALIDRATNEPIGTVFLCRAPGVDDALTEDFQVGWHLRPDYWGRGYATEAGRWAVERGFQVLKLPVLIALVEAGNTASMGVARRLGMQPQGPTTRYYGGEELELFRLEATDYFARYTR